MKRIITSILDTDIYKLYMLQAFYHQYPNATGHWEFKCRNKDIKMGFLKDQVIEQVTSLSKLKLSMKEAYFLKDTGYFSNDFINWFQNGFFLDPKLVKVEDINGELKIECKGKLILINLFEIFILSIVNELYFINDRQGSGLKLHEVMATGGKNLIKEISKLEDHPDIKFIEFGTRRRYSKEWQKQVVGLLNNVCPNMIGTSNMKLAMDLKINPIGTCAHEWTMAHLGLVDRIEQAQKRSLCVWQQEYGSKLAIALSDTFTTNSFLRDFDSNLSNSFSGLRQDSGNPFKFGDKVISHYKNMNIDPMTKTIVFSDSLDIDKTIEIYNYFKDRINVVFGIGTFLTNNVGIKPLNIVMKLMSCNNTPCVKLSDDIGKAMGDTNMIKKVKSAYGVS